MEQLSGISASKVETGLVRTDRLFGEHGLEKETAATRREFERRMEALRLKPDGERSACCAMDGRWERKTFAIGWRINCPAADEEESAQENDRRQMKLWLRGSCWKHWQDALAGIDLARQPKGHSAKMTIARQLRAQTPMSRQWIADRLRMGSASYVSNLLNSVDS